MDVNRKRIRDLRVGVLWSRASSGSRSPTGWHLPDPRCQYPAPNRSQRRFPCSGDKNCRSSCSRCLALAFSGCGHSEEEWQAKLKENQDLQNQLNAEKAAHQKSEGDLGRRGQASRGSEGSAEEGGRRPVQRQRHLAEQSPRSRSSARTTSSSSRSGSASSSSSRSSTRSPSSASSVDDPQEPHGHPAARRRALRLGPRRAQEGRQGHPAKVAEVIRADKDLNAALVPGGRTHRQQAARRRSVQGQLGPFGDARARSLTFLVDPAEAKKGGGGLPPTTGARRVRRDRSGRGQRHRREHAEEPPRRARRAARTSRKCST